MSFDLKIIIYYNCKKYGLVVLAKELKNFAKNILLIGIDRRSF